MTSIKVSCHMIHVFAKKIINSQIQPHIGIFFALQMKTLKVHGGILVLISIPKIPKVDYEPSFSFSVQVQSHLYLLTFPIILHTKLVSIPLDVNELVNLKMGQLDLAINYES